MKNREGHRCWFDITKSNSQEHDYTPDEKRKHRLKKTAEQKCTRLPECEVCGYCGGHCLGHYQMRTGIKLGYDPKPDWTQYENKKNHG